jgi:hypothetical protein
MGNTACTLFCPRDDRADLLELARVSDVVKDVVSDSSAQDAILVLLEGERRIRLTPRVREEGGDSFSKSILGTIPFFTWIETYASQARKQVIDRIESTAMLIGVVADPDLEDDQIQKCVFGMAAALGADIFTGAGMLDSEGRLYLDSDGKTEVRLNLSDRVRKLLGRRVRLDW